MVISYLGAQCFKITQGELTLAINPPAKESAFKVPKFGSDIVFVSQDHPDFNGVENASFGERSPFVINGPGEYEVRGVTVRGFGAESNYGKPKLPDKSDSPFINTIYSISLDGLNLCFLGAMGSVTLPLSAKQELDDIDILFVPIGNDGVLNYNDAYKLAVQLEPKAIIPMHYSDDTLKKFLKEAGAEDVKPIEKFTVKKKDLEGKEGEIVVLSS